MPLYRLNQCLLSLCCLIVLATGVSSQTTQTATPTSSERSDMTQQKETGPSVIAPTAREAQRVAGRTNLFCAGYIRYQRFPKTPEIVGADEEQQQRTFTDGDFVYLNAGSQQGVHEGQAFQIVRPKGDLKGVHRQKKGFLGTYVQDIGQLEVTKVLERTSVAQVTFSCDMILLGDLVVGIPDRVSPLERSEANLDLFADPTGKQTGRLMMSRDGHETLTKNAVVYIDLGSEDKVSPGDYLTVYRKRTKGDLTSVDNEESARGRATGFQSDRYRGGGYSMQAQRAKDSTGLVNSEGRYRYKPITTKQIRRDRPALPRKIVGEMVIIDVQARTATAIITRAVLELHTGDWVEVQ
ncbi:MAG: hypothetical protein QOH96_111 [Blastocatellia bacterium]|jgi:hypothetical protein|nr:hypothetical protein [Blastocatellia bacterium]